MNRRLSALALGTVLPFALGVAAGAVDFKGAAILDHACCKVSVKHMGPVNAGKMDDANLLSTKEMQDMWKKLPADERMMISEMMKEMSKTEAQYATDIRAGGLLVVDGQAATLTVTETTKDANGTNTSTTTQKFRLAGTQCLITR